MSGHRERADRGALVDPDIAGQDGRRIREAGDDHVEQSRANAELDADGVEEEENSEPAGDPGHEEDRPRAQQDASWGGGSAEEGAEAGESPGDPPVTGAREREPGRRGAETDHGSPARPRGDGKEERRSGADERERDHLEQVRAEERAARARESRPAAAGGDLEDGDFRRLAEPPRENGVEERADRARGVDRAETDRRAHRGRPRQGTKRLHGGADREPGRE